MSARLRGFSWLKAEARSVQARSKLQFSNDTIKEEQLIKGCSRLPVAQNPCVRPWCFSGRVPSQTKKLGCEARGSWWISMGRINIDIQSRS